MSQKIKEVNVQNIDVICGLPYQGIPLATVSNNNLRKKRKKTFSNLWTSLAGDPPFFCVVFRTYRLFGSKLNFVTFFRSLSHKYKNIIQMSSAWSS